MPDMPSTGTHKRHWPRFGLRAQLAVISLVALALPLLGYRAISAMESELRHNLEQTQFNQARALASLAAQQPDKLGLRGSAASIGRLADHLYVPTTARRITIDGYNDDWHDVISATPIISASGNRDLAFRFRLVHDQHALYGLLEVYDRRVVYRPSPTASTGFDWVRLSLGQRDQAQRRYQLATAAPGRLQVHEQGANRIANEMQAAWQESAQGYRVEWRLPLTVLTEQLRIEVLDNDDRSQAVYPANKTSSGEFASLAMRPWPVRQSFVGLLPAGSRLWIIDHLGRVQLQAGELSTQTTGSQDRGPLYGLIRLLLQRQYRADISASPLRSLITPAQLQAIQAGQMTRHWHGSENDPVNSAGQSLLTSWVPIQVQGQFGGAVGLQTSRAHLLVLQNTALAEFVRWSILAWLVTVAVFLLYASILSWRIRRLRDSADTALGQDGRVRAQFKASPVGDEIGDLSRSYAELIKQVHHYTQYLESLGSKLSHELRTPLSVVQSSLENLASTQSGPESKQAYLHRAHQGVHRLQDILTRLREASRLEQSMQQVERQRFSLDEVLAGCVQGYRDAYPGFQFDYQAPQAPTDMSGSPDLIAQMLDKLVDNARDFSPPGAVIGIELQAGVKQHCLRVINQGSRLPDVDSAALFDSMASWRSAGGEDQPHLGLGLYIVRLITQVHHGRLHAFNLDNGQGVCFEICLPAND